LFRHLKETTRQAPVESVLVEALLERTLRAQVGVEASGEDLADRANDPSQRAHVRVRFFADMAEPRGEQFVCLTLATLLHLAVGAAAAQVPPARQPRRNEQFLLGFELARRVHPLIEAEGRLRTDELQAVLFDTIRDHSRLNVEESEVIALEVMEYLSHYVSQGASPEFLAGLQAPDRPMEAVFFAEN
jgi:hypothetical protein